MATAARAVIKKTKNILAGVTLLLRSTSHSSRSFIFKSPSPLSPPSSHSLPFSTPHTSFYRHFSLTHSGETSDDGASTDGWEEEDEAEPKIGDGGSGGGVALQNVPWGQRVLSIAEEVLMKFSEDIKLFAFKTSPRGYVYVRLDKLTSEYGCPSMEELESYNQEFKKRLDEVGALGDIPDDLALEVSSPGADRILKVPDDLTRFEDMPMRVSYTENIESNCREVDGVFFLDSIEKDSETCVWKLADVKENRDPTKKGKPLNRKQKDWRLRLSFDLHTMVTLYVDY
ncbi:unnamed protein product [Lathyrus oleraceus]|uniref:DUF7912 domain-containing protein n=1 Tax=Pisum sativum TaxID=3888 RepID=A0A9D4YE28_PEA|nr:uncharacterized protein LOC127119688 [Pisum sativum]KAI5437893.1 hypothetical protein KIW84_023858 [Pisum sativum]